MTLAMVETPADPKATKVLIHGTVFNWAEKAPFTPSGQSVLGALEVTEDEMKIKCHDCGRWCGMLNAQHLRPHGLSGFQYRNRHGLRINSSLASPAIGRMHSQINKKMLSNPTFRDRIVARLREVGPVGVKASRRVRSLRSLEWRGERANLQMSCRAQLSIRLNNLAVKLGRTPTYKEISTGDEHGRIDRRSIEWAFRMTIREALCAIGLTPNRKGRQRIAAPTELAILQLRSRGMSYKEIAARLAIDRHTVSTHAWVASRPGGNQDRAESNSGDTSDTASSR